MELNILGKSLLNIEIEDLEYVERDLCFGELASIAILLYGEERTTAEFALQKLLVISASYNANKSNKVQLSVSSDLLRTYAQTINRTNWRHSIAESLAIINARRVLRKLGLKWSSVREYYLPHVTDFSPNLHPLVKALYKICDSLTPAQSGRLILYMDQHHRPQQEHFRFYNSEALEVFMLDWITRRIITLGDCHTKGANLQVLFEYFKFNELEDMKSILIDALEFNSAERVSDNAIPAVGSTQSNVRLTESNQVDQEIDGNEHELSPKYSVNFKSAGIALVINQREFYMENDAEVKHLLHKERLSERRGTDVDKKKLNETFSSFGYDVIVEENLTHVQMLATIGDWSRRSLLFDSIIVCILSHGFEGSVYGANSVPVTFTEIEEKLTTSELENKPKLLIIQACQSKPTALVETQRKSNSPTKYADILRAVATVSGFNSLRHPEEGTWFIQHLCNAINRLCDKQHMADILTTVKREIADKKGARDEEVMIPQTYSTLRKDFRLPPRK